jgi:hypothetical protein
MSIGKNYLAIDKSCDSVDFLLSAHRDRAAECHNLDRSINQSDLPEKQARAARMVRTLQRFAAPITLPVLMLNCAKACF